jgi:predicted CxxxxCH...CXXCH cytochrome family protein
MRPIAIVVLLAGCLGSIDDYGADPSQQQPNADPQAGCAGSCHGNEQSNAPPMGLTRSTDTATVGIGAHAQHMDPAPTWHRAVACADCHLVPAEVSSPGHIDDADQKAELTFSALAGANAAWSGTTCTTGCHGIATWGGTAIQPLWTRVDGTQSACGSCHGAPPPPPHPAGANCASCHPSMEDNSLAFRDPALHINGVVDVVAANATGGCTGTCHGSTNSAPPKALDGSTTSPTVGAHQAHLAKSTWHRDLACSTCHTVPATVDAPGHRDGDNIAEVKFDGLNAASTYTRATATCANQYCHGTGLATKTSPAWTSTTPLACVDGCHGGDPNRTAMSAEHRRGDHRRPCVTCHKNVVSSNTTILDITKHVNGVRDVQFTATGSSYNPATKSCTGTGGGCHGNGTRSGWR